MKNNQPMITVLPTRAPRKGSSETTIGSGRLGTMTKASGLGKQMVANLEGVKKNYAAQAKADRRQAALDRLAECNGEVIDY
jgi:formiminotetrahydrofolate cyclodeaminase